MCYFIAVGMDSSKVRTFEAKLHYPLVPAPVHVASLFRPDETGYLVDVGHCACAFFRSPVGPEDIEHLRITYGRRGWSKKRIERVIGEQSRLGGLALGIVQRLADAAKESGPVSLLVFWDDGKTIPRRPEITIPAAMLVDRRISIRSGAVVRVEG